MIGAMRCWTRILILALAACGAGDDTADGTRARCAEGGALNDCEDAARTPEDACWRMVDCGALELHSDNNNRFDWDNCVNTLERRATVQQRLIISCIATSTCDQLKLRSERGQIPCFLLGDN